MYKYFKFESTLPCTSGPLSSKDASPSMTKHVDSGMVVNYDSKKQDLNIQLSPKDKTKNGNYTVTHETTAAIIPNFKWVIMIGKKL